MKIRNGIKMFCDVDYTPGRLMINSGVDKGDNFDIYQEKKYSDDSYKPRPDWRELTNEEKEIVLSVDDQITPHNNIALRKLPKETISLLEQMHLERSTTYKELFQAFQANHEIVNELSRSLNKMVFASLSRDEDLSFHKLTFAKPGIETLAYYPKLSANERQYIGLHVDKSEPYTENELGTTRNRLSINIGTQARHLLIVNLELSVIIGMLKEREELIGMKIDLDDVPRLFFKYFPDYPVLKIRQNPYEYYIVPTDNLLHDGSTLEMTNADFTLIYLGYFNLHEDQEVISELGFAG